MARPWRESDHPRDPANGEFVEKTGWAGRVVTAMFGGGHRKVVGRDIRTKLDYDQLAQVAVSGNSFSGGPDPALDTIVRAQGFDGMPEVLTGQEMDDRVASGWTETWRGVHGYRVVVDPARPYSGSYEVSTPEAAEQFRSGDYWAGLGVFGNGTYATPTQDYALGYADYANGGLLRIAISPEARVVDWDELQTRYNEKYRSAWSATGVMIRGMKHYEPGSPGRLGHMAVKERLADKAKVLADMGRMAAAMGYDAIAVQPRNQTMRDGRTMYYVILNRTAVAVQDRYVVE